jgi:flagellar motor switch protein FliN/FliY
MDDTKEIADDGDSEVFSDDESFGDTETFDDAEDSKSGNINLDSISNIPVEISAVLGSCKMQVNQLLKLGRGAVITLDRKVGEPIDILVNDRLVAKGEVIVVENKIGVTLTEIIKS